ncbi:MAG: sigma factor-like helix-turn-helix DNA-binding protein [Gemmatimonadaceae bacterium]
MTGSRAGTGSRNVPFLFIRIVDPNAEPRARTRDREGDDAQLVARIAAGDERALGSLYDTYGAVVFGLAVAITQNHTSAESVVAEAFATVWRDARSFEPGRRSAFAWLSSLVRTLALADRDARGVKLEQVVTADSPTTPVAAALARLSRPQRAAVELAYFRGLSRRDIAAVLGESEITVGVYLRSGIEALRDVEHAPAPQPAHRMVARV